MENTKSKTKDGKKLEKGTCKGLDGFALDFAKAINFDALAKAIKKGLI